MFEVRPILIFLIREQYHLQSQADPSYLGYYRFFCFYPSKDIFKGFDSEIGPIRTVIGGMKR